MPTGNNKVKLVIFYTKEKQKDNFWLSLINNISNDASSVIHTAKTEKSWTGRSKSNPNVPNLWHEWIQLGAHWNKKHLNACAGRHATHLLLPVQMLCFN